MNQAKQCTVASVYTIKVFHFMYYNKSSVFACVQEINCKREFATCICFFNENR